MHIVTFDGNQKIQQIRLMWDQGSLLKSVEVIGSRGKNWPVRDGKDQIQALSTSIESSLAASMNGSSLSDERQGRREKRAGSTTAQSVEESDFASPRAAARPPTRDYHDLFAAGAELPPDHMRSPSKSNPLKAGAGKNYHDVRLFDGVDDQPERSESPSKGNPLKAGAGKNYHEVRAFGEAQDPPERSQSPSKGNPLRAGAGKNYHEVRAFGDTPIGTAEPTSPEKTGRKAHPKKYNHFEFGEQPLNIKAKPDDKSNKHSSQWDFSDFVTPEKPRARHPAHEERHFGWSDDEEEAKQPPVHRQQKMHPRKDAESHFDFKDDATPKASQAEKKHTHGASSKMGLYEDHVNLGDPEKHNRAEGQKVPLGNITNVPISSQGHKKNFSSQFEMTDDSPSNVKSENTGQLPEGKKKATKIMEANWSMMDEEPAAAKHKGINIQGDGMGSKKGGEKPWWDYE